MDNNGERDEKDIGRICTMCNHEIYFDNIGDIECKCGDEQESQDAQELNEAFGVTE